MGDKRSVKIGRRRTPRQLARHWIEFCWNTRDTVEMAMLMSPEIVVHGLGCQNTTVTGANAFMRLYSETLGALPGLHARVISAVAEDDRVAVHLRAYAEPPLGSALPAVAFDGMCLMTWRDGRLVEIWHYNDNLTLMRQLGIVA